MGSVKSEVFYIGYFTEKGNPNNFLVFPSCNNKMNYIINAIKSNAIKVNVFSLGEGRRFNKAKYQEVDKLENIFYVSTIPNISWLKILSTIWLFLQVIYFLLFKVSTKDVVIVYHTYKLLPIIKIAKKIKKINLIIEVEEIYSAAWRRSDKLIKKEIKNLQIADKYILINDLIGGQCNFTKPSVICYGNYEVNYNKIKKVSSDKISIVYAGIIENKGSDVFLAIDAMKYLPSNYYLKIVGYGSQKNIDYLKKYIKHFNNVVYDGLLKGTEYTNYLQNCDIGISPRLLEDKYSDFTFPSKVLVYLSNGLITVSTNIKAIKESKVSDSIYFINELTPLSVAESILKIDYENLKNLNIVSELDQNFKKEIKKLINDFN